MATLKIELPSQPSLRENNLRRWAELMANPKFARLEERLETDRFGNLILSPPPSAHHGSYQFRVGALLDRNMAHGRVITECPISTADGVKAADVAWASPARLNELGTQACFTQAPEICVEVLSPGNSAVEIQLKTALYFDAGAREVWHCSDTGEITFLRAGESQPLAKSQLCPSFPARIEL